MIQFYRQMFTAGLLACALGQLAFPSWAEEPPLSYHELTRLMREAERTLARSPGSSSELSPGLPAYLEEAEKHNPALRAVFH
ncbi:MAG: hypothetical protein JW937_00825, partial [Candidatus Omnitrophica bacterium]|nr:hypothetical protein [Candidatus Omnitrophota bacterium]